MLFPVMLQGWHTISCFHWSCDRQLIQGRLPRGLEVDTFDGKAWISITPFLLRGLRPPLFPQALGLNFPETNFRTYVRGPKGPGIWFFSLDAARLSAVVGARTAYGLPYYWSTMQVEDRENEMFYYSDRGGRARTPILEFEETLRRTAALDFTQTEFIAHYSPGGDTQISRPHLLTRTSG